jgi:SNO glutamine amidotransferase family
VAEGLPAYGSCAGMILLADRIEAGIEGQETIGGLDVVVRRNAFGRQVDSFEADVRFADLDPPGPVHAVFIRAPWAESLGAGVRELAHTPWTERLEDSAIAAAAARMRWVSTLDIHGFGRDTPELRSALDNLMRFHRAGGRIAYGTDLGNGPIPSGAHVTELQWLRQAGLTTEQVLETFVRAPIEIGAPADLLVAGESPLGDVAALADIRFVVRAGTVVN